MNQNAAQIVSYLQENGVAAEYIDHPPAASAAEYQATLGTKLEQQVKVLLVKAKTAESPAFAAVALQAQKKVDLKLIAKLCNASKARLADKDSLLEQTGCSFGELHPFSSLFGIPLLMDKDFLDQEKVYINAGSLTRSIAVTPSSIVELERPTLF